MPNDIPIEDLDRISLISMLRKKDAEIERLQQMLDHLGNLAQEDHDMQAAEIKRLRNTN